VAKDRRFSTWGLKKYPMYNSDGIPFMDGKSLYVDNKGNLTHTVYHAGVLIKQSYEVNCERGMAKA